jgi:hypothetical protein
LIAVKANQPNLFNEIAHQFEQAPVISVHSEDEKPEIAKPTEPSWS